MYAQKPNDLMGGVANTVGVANAMQENKLLQTGNAQKHLDLINNMYGSFNAGLGALAQKKDLSLNDISDFANTQVKLGRITPQMAAVEMQNAGALGNDPAKLQAFAQQHLYQSMSAQEQYNARFGSPMSISNGQQTQVGAYSPSQGFTGNGPRVQQLLSPEAKSAMVPTVNSNGQQGVIPKSSVVTDTGDARGQGNIRFDASGKMIDPQPQTQPVAPAVPQPAAPANAPGAASMQPQGFVPSAAPPGVPEARAAQGRASGDMMAKDQEIGRNYQASINPMMQALPLLEKLGQTGTGPGTERLNDLKSFAVSLGVPGAQNFTDSVKAYDEVRKYLTQNALSGDTSSDQRLLATVSGNPSIKISNAAATDLVKTGIALKRMEAARGLANSDVPPEQYAKVTADWMAKQDPRAYAVDLMSPEAKKALAKALGAPGSDAYKKFAASLQAAEKAKVLSQPGQ